ncbi:interferon-gamma-inducible GTPase 10-like [Ruditapes philippinarum]|uniref:interferon-gamma-inducible GTPase 10-like n=1 Tax=Ruditapes philippinarum TaxID=129788 RepID=UPI00295A8FCC|nr:interferon-gamma-inducible GTPase 10-like [Ruditapes philippinarum]
MAGMRSENTLANKVIGQTGVGKSTFINFIQGLKTGEEGAADTNIRECTKTIKSYNHPKNKNTSIVFWYLPGVGTENFKREYYDDTVQLANYYCFLIFSSERFLEDDEWLANTINKMGKKFYFVGTKVLNDISNEAKGTGAIPLPGLNTVVDFVVMLTEIMLYREQFGLTEDAIKRSAEMLGVRKEELKMELQMTDLIMNCTVKG